MRTEAIRIRKGLSIYKQPKGKGKGSPFWYARVYMAIGGKTTHVQSTRTTDVRTAKNLAEAFWLNKLLEQRGSAADPSEPAFRTAAKGRFDRVADQFFESLELDAGSDPTSQRRLKDYHANLFSLGGFAAFFGSEDVGAVTTARIRDYLRFQVEKSRKGALAASSQKRCLVTLNMMMKYAYEQRLITSVPLMPKLKTKDNPRAWFEKAEYEKLWRTCDRLASGARKKGDKEEERRWVEMHDFIVFMVNCFLRPGEWTRLRFKNIKVFDDKHKRLEISLANSKTGMRKVYSMPRAVDVYRRMRIRASGEGEYLFKNSYENRATAMERMQSDFSHVLDEAELRFDGYGRRRCMYSLRHTSLMLRFTESDNMDIFTLAKNAGTSVEQLQRFYLNRLDPIVKIEALQSFRKV